MERRIDDVLGSRGPGLVLMVDRARYLGIGRDACYMTGRKVHVQASMIAGKMKMAPATVQAKIKLLGGLRALCCVYDSRADSRWGW